MDERIGAVATNLALGQRLKKVIFTAEFRYLHTGSAYFLGSMGIAAGALADAVFYGEHLSLS